MTFDVDAAFGELRSLVHGAPSVRAFSAICRLAQEVEEAAPGIFADTMLGYAQAELTDWPVSCVTLQVACKNIPAFARLVWSPLVRGVEVTETSYGQRFKTEDLIRLMGRLGVREHLSLSPTGFGVDSLLEFVEGGMFDGVRSLQLNSMRWVGRVGALCDAVIAREGMRGLDALRLRNCSPAAEDMERLSGSELAGRLKTLGLSSSRRQWVREEGGYEPGVTALFGSLERFGRLERLELTRCHLVEEDAIALARAPAPESLAHVAMGGHELGPVAIREWLDAGRVGWWLDREGAVALDTSGFRFDGDTLGACAEVGLFDEVERWTCGYGTWGAHFTDVRPAEFETWAPLRDRPKALARLRELDMMHVPMDEALCGEVLDTLERAPLELLNLYPPTDAHFERALESRWSSQLDALTLRGTSAQAHGERALRALLDWGRLDEVDVCGAEFEVAADAPGRLGLPSGFAVGGDGDRRKVNTRKAYRQQDSDVCVDVDGRVQGNWMWRWRERHGIPHEE